MAQKEEQVRLCLYDCVSHAEERRGGDLEGSTHIHKNAFQKMKPTFLPGDLQSSWPHCDPPARKEGRKFTLRLLPLQEARTAVSRNEGPDSPLWCFQLSWDQWDTGSFVID